MPIFQLMETDLVWNAYFYVYLRTRLSSILAKVCVNLANFDVAAKEVADSNLRV